MSGDPTITSRLSNLEGAANDALKYAQLTVAAVVNLRVANEQLSEFVTDPTMGTGRYTSNPDLLTNDQMAEIEKAVKAGDLVLVSLFNDIGQPRNKIARLQAMDGEAAKVVLWGDDEARAGTALTLDNPRKQVWGWYVVSKVSGV